MENGLRLPYLDIIAILKSIVDFLAGIYPNIVGAFKGIEGIIVGISIPLSLFFLIVIIYCVEQLKKIRRKEAEIYDIKVVSAYEDNVAKGDHDMSKRWQSVVAHISSNNPNDWRQAIIEADIILDTILTRMGYQGQTVGEKLKRVEKGDINTLDDAWEAHKVRNQIAHEGSNFTLNSFEAKKAFNSYKKVFEEFYYV